MKDRERRKWVGPEPTPCGCESCLELAASGPEGAEFVKELARMEADHDYIGDL